MSDVRETTNNSVQEVVDLVESKLSKQRSNLKHDALFVQASDSYPESMAPQQLLSSTASMSSFSSISLTAAAVHTSMGQEFSNKTPLPKVDVLIKGRTFQSVENQNTSSLGSSKPSLSPSLLDSSGSDSQISEQSDSEWKKESISEIAPSSVLAPLPTHQSYTMDYTQQQQSSRYTIQENGAEVAKNEPRDPSPVYHQMERPILPLADPGIYSNHLAMSSNDYNDLNTTVNEVPPETLPSEHSLQEPSDMVRVQEIEVYGHGNSNQADGDHNAPRYSHIRAWEQENSRYVDYAWRGEEPHHTISETAYVKTNSDDDDDDDDDDPDSSFIGSQRPRRSSGRVGNGGKVSGNGTSSRRRRKRVQTPVQRSAANMRERRRMCHLNVAFDHLKDHLPHVKDKKKLSRIQTLKAAIYYIHLLQDSLNTAPRVSEL